MPAAGCATFLRQAHQAPSAAGLGRPDLGFAVPGIILDQPALGETVQRVAHRVLILSVTSSDHSLVKPPGAGEPVGQHLPQQLLVDAGADLDSGRRNADRRLLGPLIELRLQVGDLGF
jgi:hypothetical protein